MLFIEGSLVWVASAAALDTAVPGDHSLVMLT